MNVPGLDKVKEDIKKIRERSTMYTVFSIPNIDPVEYKIVKNGGLNYKGELIINYKEKDLKDVFDSCIQAFDTEKPYLVIYDFVFYDRDLWRNTFCLISFIPDSLNVKNRVVYSTNALKLISELEIPLHISFNKMTDLTYDSVKDRCSKFKTK